MIIPSPFLKNAKKPRFKPSSVKESFFSSQVKKNRLAKKTKQKK